MLDQIKFSKKDKKKFGKEYEVYDKERILKISHDDVCEKIADKIVPGAEGEIAMFRNFAKVILNFFFVSVFVFICVESCAFYRKMFVFR